MTPSISDTDRVERPHRGRYEIDSHSGFGSPGRSFVVVTQIQELGFGGEPYAVIAVGSQNNELVFEQDVWEALRPVRCPDEVRVTSAW